MVVVELICLLLLAVVILLLVYVVFSWIPSPPEPIRPLVRWVARIVNPMLEPLRRVLPPLQFGGIGLDMSVLVLFVVIFVIRGALRCPV
ncbi:MAG: YggT family protein [Actinobacteria bacterium]|nr:YggT family protein [Actinomycetota bacterium]